MEVKSGITGQEKPAIETYDPEAWEARRKAINRGENSGLTPEEKLAEQISRHHEKRRLQKAGELPPDKAPLNRKKFAASVMTEYGEMDPKRLAHYLWKVVPYLVSEDMPNVTPEQVGMLKLIKAAIEFERFERGRIQSGHPAYKRSILYEQVIEPVTKL